MKKLVAVVQMTVVFLNWRGEAFVSPCFGFGAQFYTCWGAQCHTPSQLRWIDAGYGSRSSAGDSTRLSQLLPLRKRSGEVDGEHDDDHNAETDGDGQEEGREGVVGNAFGAGGVGKGMGSEAEDVLKMKVAGEIPLGDERIKNLLSQLSEKNVQTDKVCERNWRRGTCSHDLLCVAKDTIQHLQWKGGELAFGTDKGGIFIVSFDTGSVIESFKGHDGEVTGKRRIHRHTQTSQFFLNT
ncbi:unnamed protein product [Choristocarpus tenellus]